MQIWQHERIFEELDPPYETPPEEDLRDGFPQELELVSRIWFETGRLPALAAHLNLVLLCEFALTHDREFPHRFQSLRSLRTSFLETDRLLRDATDSGKKATGGISSDDVRTRLAFVSDRLRKSKVPRWMPTYVAFSFVECVERAAPRITLEEKALHLSYLSKVFRIMGLSFTNRREQMEEFARHVEGAHTGRSPLLKTHARNLLLLAEMIGVSAEFNAIAPLLAEGPRKLFREIYPEIRPDAWQRQLARASARFFASPSAGKPRRAVQATDWRRPVLPEASDQG
jgi:hypothetical protein